MEQNVEGFRGRAIADEVCSIPRETSSRSRLAFWPGAGKQCRAGIARFSGLAGAKLPAKPLKDLEKLT